MKTLETKKAPAAIGPYSQAKMTGNFLFASGQIPVDPATGEVAGDKIETQAEQSCKNVGAILEEAGLTFDNVIKTTCFLADMADFAAFNAVYEKYFTSKPARSCVAVKQLSNSAKPQYNRYFKTISESDSDGENSQGKIHLAVFGFQATCNC